MKKLKEQQAKTAAEAEEHAAHIAEEKAAAEVAAVAKAEAEKKRLRTEAFLKEKIEKQAVLDAEAKAKKAKKLAEEKAAADQLVAEKAAAEKLAAERREKEASVLKEKKAVAMLEKRKKDKANAEKLAAERAAAATVVAEKRQAMEAKAKSEAEAKAAKLAERKAATPVKTPKSTPTRATLAAFRGASENVSPNKRDRAETPTTANKRNKKKVKTGSVTPFKLTVPSSPKFAQGRRNNRSMAKTTEEMEMESIQEKQAKLREQRAQRKKKVVKAPDNVPAKSSKTLTEPKEFKFMVREKAQADEPKMFGEFTSLAECVSSFETRTPRRFKGRAANMPPSPMDKMDASKLTTPQSPSFVSDKRSRPAAAYQTREEKEVEMMAEFAKNPFKAQPLNAAILESAGTIGVSAIEKKELTQAVSPKFASDARARKHVIEAPVSPKPFKASKIGAGVPELKMAKIEVKKCTVAVSPTLTSARRARAVEVEEVKPVAFKAQPIPAAVVKPHKPVEIAHKPLTEPKPFKLHGDALHAQAQAEAERKRAEEERKLAEARNFKATPIQHYTDTHSCATPSAPTLTESAPFNLASDKLHAAAKADWEKQLEAELEEERAQFSSFRAKPAAVLEKSPFIAKKSNKALTEISNFTLASDKRSAEREQFDIQVAQKQRELDIKKQEEAEAKIRAEEEEVQIMRKTQMSFKATPIMNFDKPFTAQLSAKALTTPYSPALATKAKYGAKTHAA